MLITDPIDLALDANGDLIVDGDARFATGLDAVAQGLRRRIAKVRGEFFADLSRGVPWLARDGVPESEAILGSKFDAVRIKTEIRTAILASPGVHEILRLLVEYTAGTRSVSVSWAVSTVFGEVTGEETF